MYRRKDVKFDSDQDLLTRNHRFICYSRLSVGYGGNCRAVIGCAGV